MNFSLLIVAMDVCFFIAVIKPGIATIHADILTYMVYYGFSNEAQFLGLLP